MSGGSNSKNAFCKKWLGPQKYHFFAVYNGFQWEINWPFFVPRTIWVKFLFYRGRKWPKVIKCSYLWYKPQPHPPAKICSICDFLTYINSNVKNLNDQKMVKDNMRVKSMLFLSPLEVQETYAMVVSKAAALMVITTCKHWTVVRSFEF